MSYTVNLLIHMKSIRDSVARFGADAVAMVDARTFRLDLRARNRHYEFIPQFVYRSAGKLTYTPQMPENPGGFVGFIGWLPYFNKRWPLALDKLAFKERCLETGLRTPRAWREPSSEVREVLAKKRHSSFGRGIRGPFRLADSGEAELSSDGAEYYEEFIRGRIAKVWYWEDKPVCCELLQMPTVTGNGRDSVYRLVELETPSARAAPAREEIEALARFQGLELDDVPAQGRAVLADFRYLSPLHPIPQSNTNALAQCLNTDLGRQLSEAGLVLWREIPEELRASTLFTVDAIVDSEERVWFLEMNCNPHVHPDVYPPMLEGLFGPASPALVAERPPRLADLPGLRDAVHSRAMPRFVGPV